MSAAHSPPASPPSSPPAATPRPGVVSGEMGDYDILADYNRRLSDDPTMSYPIAAIESLSSFCEMIGIGTIHELLENISQAADTLVAAAPNHIAATAGCELYKKFIIQHVHDDPRDYNAFRENLRTSGLQFAAKARASREGAAANACKAITEGLTVFTVGYSRCVMLAFKKAKAKGVNFKVIVAVTLPCKDGLRTAKELREIQVPVAVVEDSAIGYAMYQARIALIGAEAILGDGSAINVMGSFHLALAASRFASRHKLYVVAETHKFVDLFPLNQFDHRFRQKLVVFDPPGIEGPMPQESTPFFDHVPHEYISGIITETGLRTTQMVSNEIVERRFR